MHARAFDGLSILIFGQEPLLPMRIEQTIATAVPSLEIGLESFEDYHQALAHARASGRCGIVMALDTKGLLPISDVFENLLKPWEESSGIPGTALLLAAGQPHISGFQIVANDRRILAYKSAQEFLDLSSARISARALWDAFIERLERFVVPDACADWIVALANERGVASETLHFTRRLAIMFRGRTNLDWREAMALPWFPITDTLQHYRPLLNHRSRALFELTDVLGPQVRASDNLAALTRAGSTTGSRLRALIAGLDYRRNQGTLVHELDDLARIIKPFDAALLRITAAESKRIIEFASDASLITSIPKAG